MIDPRHVASIALAAVVTLAAVPGHGAALPSWDKRVDKPARFKVLSQLDGEAVLDKETGLVWTRSPSLSIFGEPAESEWADAMTLCPARRVGGRFGWRLPALWELMSLRGSTGDLLQAGHPFQEVDAADIFWSATTWAEDPTRAVTSRLSSNSGVIILAKEGTLLKYLCVRGPGGTDAGH